MLEVGIGGRLCGIANTLSGAVAKRKFQASSFLFFRLGKEFVASAFV